VVVLALWLATPAAALKLEVRAHPVANLWWLLQVMAGDPLAQTEAMRQWWQDEGYARPQDDARLAEFASLRERYRGDFLRQKLRENKWVPVPPPAGHRLDVRFAQLFLGARDWADLRARSEVLLTDRDAEVLEGVVRHFAPQVDQAWPRLAHVPAFALALEQLLADKRISVLLDSVARWLGTDADGVVRVQVVLAAPGDRLNGRRLGRDLVLEVRPRDTPLSRSDVVVHEAVHYLQERAGQDDDPALLNAVFAGNHPAAAVAWGLLPEAVATAIGQGVWQQQAAPQAWQESLQRPQGWYSDPAIDQLAKALAPALTAQLATDKHQLDLMPRLLEEAGRLALPRGTWLQRYIAVASRHDAPVWQAMHQIAPPRAVWRVSLAEATDVAQRFGATTLLVAVTAAELPQIVRQRAALGLPTRAIRQLQQLTPGYWQQKRAGGARLVVAVARTEAALALVLAELAQQQEIHDGFTAAPTGK
jgi:hypothetical protein